MEERQNKTYEIAYLLRFEEDNGEIEKVLNAHNAKLTKDGGRIPLRFAYTIKKEKSGFFGYGEFEAGPEEIAAITKTLELNSKILRFLILTPPVGKPVARRGERRDIEKTEKPALQSKMLTNEALEEKLEEILK